MIDQALMEGVIAIVETRSQASDEGLLRILRETFPGVHFSVCSDDDVPPRVVPVAESASCRLYGVDSRSHCLAFAADVSEATGLLVAMVEEEKR